METTEKPAKERKKPGPVAQGLTRYNVMLEENLGEWGKHQPGGLSETLRRLLREAMAKEAGR